MKEPTHFDMCIIIATDNSDDFFKYINEELIKNDSIKIIKAHSKQSFDLKLGSSLSYYVGVFAPKGNKLMYEAPNFFFYNTDEILYNKYNQAIRDYEPISYPLNDKGISFNFDLTYSHLRISFNELQLLLELAQKVRCSFFINTELK